MRIIDIAVGTGYAALCLMLVFAMNPVVSEETSSQLAAQSRLDGAIDLFVERVGLVDLNLSPAADLCQTAAEMSNSTVGLSLAMDGVDCRPAPPFPIASSDLTLALPDRTVTVEAWLARG